MNTNTTLITKGSRQVGLSLVELMVASVIGLVLLAGLLQIFISSKHTYAMQQQVARVQEDLRFANTFLGRGIRRAGYAGCMPDMDEVHNISDLDEDGSKDDISDLTNGGITGFGYTDLPISLTPVANLTTGEVVADTDILRITDVVGTGTGLVGNMTADNANIQVDPSAVGLFEKKDLLLISDCSDADAFRATSVSEGSAKITVAHANSVNISNRLSKAYRDDAELFLLRRSLYYIGPDADGTPNLFRKSFVGNSVETEPLVPNVADMRIRYGEDTDADGSVDRYVDAGTVTDWPNVLSARVELLVQSAPNTLATADTSSTYDLQGHIVGPFGDRRLRRTLSTTFAIRNQF